MEGRRVIQGRRTPEAVVQYHIQRQRSSGLGIAEYCRRQGFSAWTFHLWRKRVEQRQTSSQSASAPRLSFIELPGPTASADYELSLGGGVSLRFGRERTPAEVAALVRALRDSGGGR